ncbi:hypothetical protein NQ318_021031 [Aromia moschata]|uniref:FHA domain-containing protein n=1 Tax=Aromia moschata TaxID=1265417 RepID=A0AAV8YN69_9CUCU|nr:hypothetical protein NQ318_021031 [Aromia moschata]
MDADNKNESAENSSSDGKTETDPSFKKPVLIGKIGRLPRKVLQQRTSSNPNLSEEIKENHKHVEKTDLTEKYYENTDQTPSSATSQILENKYTLLYKEPIWSGLPQKAGIDYVFEVLKNGTIIETINLMSRPFWVFGRLADCSISMQHPTISRYHAILQYRSESSESDVPGFYIYDLGSHTRLKPKVYTRIQVGHMLKLGCSTRSYILNGPESDQEEESELSVTELRQKSAEELHRLEEEAKATALQAEKEREEKLKKEEERGIDWGLGEDADEETDLSENPFAQTTNEELYLDDPKKALRGFFEREGLDLEYDCTEQGIGQFLCKVELPVDNELGRPIVAEVLHKGKKKEAVVQCALEACRILDRYGVLRQATHESRKRKAKNWEENDYYDSDDDTFLDRTGAIEKKREKRMNAKIPQKAETYESLVEKEKSFAASIADLEKQLAVAQKDSLSGASNNEEDSLDTFMKELKESKPDKEAISKLKLELTHTKAEHANIVRLINIAKPASLPPLSPHYSSVPSTSKDSSSKGFPIIGKRKKTKMQLPEKPLPEQTSLNINTSEVEEEDEEVEENEDSNNRGEITENSGTDTNVLSEREDAEDMEQDVEEGSESSLSSNEEGSNTRELSSIKSLHSTMTFKKFEKILKKGLPPFADKHQEKLEKILNNLKKLAANEDRMHVDWKILAAKKRKVMKLISDLKNCKPNEKLEHKVSSELNRILSELNTMTEQKYKVIDKVKKMGHEIKTISNAIDKDFREYKREMSKILDESEDASASGSSGINRNDNVSSEGNISNDDRLETDERKKKKNQRRIQQRQERAESERQRGYEEDALREDYNMWIPPSGQTAFYLGLVITS